MLKHPLDCVHTESDAAAKSGRVVRRSCGGVGGVGGGGTGGFA